MDNELLQANYQFLDKNETDLLEKDNLVAAITSVKTKDLLSISLDDYIKDTTDVSISQIFKMSHPSRLLFAQFFLKLLEMKSQNLIELEQSSMNNLFNDINIKFTNFN